RLATTRAELAAEIVDGVQGLADLAAFGADAAQLARLGALNRDLAAAQARMAWLGGLNNGLATLVTSLGTWALLALAIPLVTGGAFPAVYLPVLALAALASFEAVAPLPLAFQHLEHSLAAAGRLFAVAGTNLSSAPSPARGGELANSRLAPLPPFPRGPRPREPIGRTGKGSGGVRPVSLAAQNLHFRYAPDEPWALDGLDFALPEGGHLAVVGPSGAGKSTLVNLLLRFWDYEDGALRVDGVELRDLDPEALRARIAVVFQHTYLFNASVRDNLLLARPGASEAEMIAASERAQLHTFVAGLPRGYDTFVGEQGLRLSGGERQRLAVARALLKDAPLLLLDEATANLDSLTEKAVLHGLRALRRGRTTVTVTHRLVGLDDADEILVLGAGKVVERGCQADLLRAGGLYRRLWDLQRQTLPPEWR
ncbi:MAG: amino acid ABC transporter ATP-binding/permease protein, partial [Chloroflexota bacterium]